MVHEILKHNIFGIYLLNKISAFIFYQKNYLSLHFTENTGLINKSAITLWHKKIAIATIFFHKVLFIEKYNSLK